ncbi:GntR family transcriptional regulator, partial [Variovorax sp. WS11]
MRASIIILLRINGRAGTSFMSNFGLQQNTSVPLYRQLK